MTLPENVGHATVMIYNLEGKQMKNIQVTIVAMSQLKF